MKEGKYFDIKKISLGNKDYPYLLSEITDPPRYFYYRGDIGILKNPTLAVVGSRKFSNYGKLATQKIVTPLAQNGVTIISGLAMGIDGIAHSTTLECGGKTVAVLGTGIDDRTIYPSCHYNLAQKILADGGLLLSEYEAGTRPTQYSFPKRNRIIAGLSLGTLVIEAAKKSGSLITASCALDYNRDVFAVPHPFNSQTAAGANNLIRYGATLVDCADDIFNQLNIEKQELPTEQMALNKNEKILLKLITDQPISIDTITKKTNLDISTASSTLTLMEIKGIIKNIGQMTYSKN